MSYAIKMIEVKCGDEVHNFPEGISAGEVIKEISGKKSGAIAALVNGFAVVEARARCSV